MRLGTRRVKGKKRKERKTRGGGQGIKKSLQDKENDQRERNVPRTEKKGGLTSLNSSIQRPGKRGGLECKGDQWVKRRAGEKTPFIVLKKKKATAKRKKRSMENSERRRGGRGDQWGGQDTLLKFANVI